MAEKLLYYVREECLQGNKLEKPEMPQKLGFSISKRSAGELRMLIQSSAA